MDTKPEVPQQTSDSAPVESKLPVTCPHCGKGFWHKIGHVFKTIGVDAVETAVNAAASNTGFGGDE